jgi:hypothetical protein
MTTPVTPRVGPDPKSYFDPLVFQREQREVFQRAWCFVAFSWELAKPNDFVTRTLGGVSVVVQNFGGEGAAQRLRAPVLPHPHRAVWQRAAHLRLPRVDL